MVKSKIRSKSRPKIQVRQRKKSNKWHHGIYCAMYKKNLKLNQNQNSKIIRTKYSKKYPFVTNPRIDAIWLGRKHRGVSRNSVGRQRSLGEWKGRRTGVCSAMRSAPEKTFDSDPICLMDPGFCIQSRGRNTTNFRGGETKLQILRKKHKFCKKRLQICPKKMVLGFYLLPHIKFTVSSGYFCLVYRMFPRKKGYMICLPKSFL